MDYTQTRDPAPPFRDNDVCQIELCSFNEVEVAKAFSRVGGGRHGICLSVVPSLEESSSTESGQRGVQRLTGRARPTSVYEASPTETFDKSIH
jgi:hypothetical protein